MTIHGLKEYYGARFPQASELDHLMALRGYLFFLSKRTGISREAQFKLSEAIDQVTSRLPSVNLPAAPRELFEHYRDVVSLHWGWLNWLRSL
jgi:hypothetical protein